MHVPVLIVGGGPIGLTASILLSRFGIESLLVNRRASTSTHPRARFVDVRTIEILRQMDLADDVIATGLPPEWVESVRYSTSMDEPEVFRLPTYSYHSVERPTSPTTPVMTAQDLIEPIMFEAGESYDEAMLQFGTELLALEQDSDACHVRIRDVETGVERQISADYVIGADGRRSSVRELLGGDLDEGFTGSGQVQDVLFHADMSRWVGDRIGALLFVFHAKGYGLFQPMDGKTRWRAQCTTFTPPIAPGDVTESDCIDWIRSAIGDTEGELELTIEGIAPWSPEARLSDAFRRGRVFLAGDAAHTLMPTGGLGMNLGYHGIHNLAWKLAYVLRGHMSPDVLSTYEVERRAQSDRTRDASVANARLAGALYRARMQGADLEQPGHDLRQYGNFEGLILGPEYQSALCAPEVSPPPSVANEIVDFIPCVRTGRRAPHVWLDRACTKSVLDLFGSHYVVLTDGAQGGLLEQVHELADSGFPIFTVELPSTAFEQGLYQRGESVVVRPDGVVATRVRAGDPMNLASLLFLA